LIRRDLYIDQLDALIDKPLIKVITGIRRCGKSELLNMLREELINRGVREEQIIYLNFESFGLADLYTAEKLYQWVKARVKGDTRYYLLLDEVQEVESWEKAVNAFRVDFNTDIYITGSNSHLLSSELATLLAGRYVEIQVYPLSFQEYLLFQQITNPATNKEQETRNKKQETLYREFDRFLRLGGFPVLHTADYSSETAYKIVYDIYSSAILRDTVQRHKIRDVELLERVVRFVFDNVGNKFSAQNVADYFKSQQRKIDLNTVYNYLNALESAFIVYRIPRYDVKGKEILKTLEKYFVGDHSLLYAVMGYRDRLISGVLENIVMLELKRRGYKVFVGKSDDREVDFIGEMKENRVYIQVAYKMEGQTTIDREFTPLLDIRDHHPKYVVTMDETWHDNIEGIQHKHIADFLVMEEY